MLNEPVTVVRADPDHERLHISSDDHRLADAVLTNGMLRDAWANAPVVERAGRRTKEWDITDHWHLLFDVFADREDSWGQAVREMICEQARRIWPETVALRCDGGATAGEPVSGSMTFGA